MKSAQLLSQFRTAFHSLQAALDRSLAFLSNYGIPTAIGLISVLALLVWNDRYEASPESHIEFHALLQSGEELSLQSIAGALTEEPLLSHFDTHLSQQPVWFTFSIPETTMKSFMVEFPSRHAIELACWDAQTQAKLGQAVGRAHEGMIAPIKAGYVLNLDKRTPAILCRARFIGPARLTAEFWTPENLLIADQDFQRDAGLLEGGMLVLAIFTLLTALINRSLTYLVFAAWLIVALRTAAISAGWDTHWLGHEVPDDWIFSIRSLTRAAYAVLTLTLFKTLFREDLKKLNHDRAQNLLTWLIMGIVFGALVLQRKYFLPLMWVLGGGALLLLFGLLVSLIRQTRSRVAILYGTSLAITFLSGMSEIIAAAFGIRVAIELVNSVTAALASSLLASIAIADQMRQEHLQRLAAQAELQHTYDAMPIGLFTLELQGRFMIANPAMHRMLGRHVLRSGKDRWQQHFGETGWLQLFQMVTQRQDGELELQSSGISSRGEMRRYLVKATLAHDKIEGSLQDVTEKSLATDELNFLANHDSLTKVLNRRGIEQVFSNAAARINSDHPMAMAYMDLDRFKLINDLYGHGAGDEVLKQVCERITGMLSGGMYVGRVGGDEFVIVLADIRIPLATVICRGILDSIDNAPYRVGDKSFHVRGSIGLIEIRQGTLMKEALSTSDRACREAKAGQHKGLVVYEKDSPALKEHEAEIRLIQHLSSSETIEGLFLEMQPIMSLTRPDESLNFEVLLRMRDPTGTLIPVNRVITAGEHSGRMSVIDRWVLSTTLAWLDQNRARLQKTQFVCMNLNGASLNDEEFLQEVFELLRGNSHVVSFLSFEITESVALHDLQNTRRFIDKVRRLGAKVALDDFGAGYTSFSYLKDLPADLLKIDGSFVVNMNQHPANVSIVEAIVNLARNLGMKTIAEWAEDTATVQTLAEIGVDYVQGFIVARPMDPEILIEATSAASFIRDAELLQLVKQMGQVEDSMTHADLILQDIQGIPRKIH